MRGPANKRVRDARDNMRLKFNVDFEMRGGDVLPDEFHLEEFCDELQASVSDVEIVAACCV